MANFNDRYIEEVNYLKDIIDLLKYKLEMETEKLHEQKSGKIQPIHLQILINFLI